MRHILLSHSILYSRKINHGAWGKNILVEKNIAPSPFFYGWIVVAAVLVLLTLTSGTVFYGLSVYLSAFVREWNLTVESVSSATSAFFLVSGISGVAVARIIERYDVRWCFAVGGLGSGLAFALTPYISSVVGVYIFYMALGAFYAACALVPCTTLVARWFVHQRSIALAVASTGLSLGGIVITPFIAQWVELKGLRDVLPLLGLSFTVCLLLITLCLRASPKVMGLAPDGAAQVKMPENPEPVDVPTFLQILQSPSFITFNISYFLIMASQVGSIVHLYNMALERTQNHTTASLILTAMAFASIIGRLAGGFLLVRFSSNVFTALLFIWQAMSFLFLALAHQPLFLFLASLCFGASLGNILMMQALIVGERVVVGHYARHYSFGQLFMTGGAAAGPLLLGVAYGAAGGYGLAYALAAGLSFLAFFFLLVSYKQYNTKKIQ